MCIYIYIYIYIEIYQHIPCIDVKCTGRLRVLGLEADALEVLEALLGNTI